MIAAFALSAALVSAEPTEKKEPSHLWGYATGLALMAAGEFGRLPRPLRATRPQLYSTISSHGKLVWAGPAPISWLGVFGFSVALASGKRSASDTIEPRSSPQGGDRHEN